MPMNIDNVISAYTDPTKGGGGLESRNKVDPGEDFASLVKQAAETALEASEKSELMSMQSLSGKTDITEVVAAVANAELTLQTVIAVRDRVIQAYQEIIRMPL
ncbi:MAG: flagellar hook-basal body complex protein FliE [Alphaproteobacteria bacterium]|nr:flagellar hook-basal body complex protein FliE [Alphaproteobacteria bacterium]